MPTQSAAFDVNRPNGTSRERPLGRALLVFRLYQKLGTPILSSVPGISSILSPVLSPIRQVLSDIRQFIRQDVLGPLQGRILVSEFRFVLILERFEQVPELRTHFGYTRDGYFIDTPLRRALGVTHFRVAGRTHWTPVLVNGVPVDGDAALKFFTEMIDDYFFPPSGRAPSDFELYMLDFRSPIAADDPVGQIEWLVHPVRFGPRVMQTSQRPFTRFFDFSFLGLQSNRDRAKAEDGNWQDTIAKGTLGNILSGLGLGSVVQAVTEVFRTVDQVRKTLDDVANVAQAATDFVIGVTQTIETTLGKVRGLLTATQTIIGRVQDGVDLARNLPNLVGDQAALVQQDFPGLVDDPDQGVICCDELGRVQDFLRALLAQPEHFVDLKTGYPEPGALAQRKVGIGATLEQIAYQAQVDPAKLVETNDLRWPFVDARERPERALARAEQNLEQARIYHQQLVEQAQALGVLAGQDLAHVQHQIGQAEAQVQQAQLDVDRWRVEVTSNPAKEHVLYAGDPIRIPVTRPDVVPSVLDLSPQLRDRIQYQTGTPATEEDRLFGFDLALNDDGDLEWDANLQDLALERGLTHMARVQARYVRLPLGQLSYAPGIGNFAWEDLGQWQGPGTERLLRWAMWQTLIQDPRVQAVERVRSSIQAGRAYLDHDVLLINQSNLQDIRVPVPVT